MALSRKIAFIDLTTGKIETRNISDDLRKKYLGGRGLGAYLLYSVLAEETDAFDPTNVVVVSSPLLAGTPGSASCPMQICSISPLTGGLLTWSGGNLFSGEMRWAGFDHLVITGASKTPVYLHLTGGKATIKEAGHLTGRCTDDTLTELREELGDRQAKALVIGPAGEEMVRFAGVISGPEDTDGGAGLGAVFGSKNLKAIVAQGNIAINLSNPREAQKWNNELNARIAAFTAEVEDEDKGVIEADRRVQTDLFETPLPEAELAFNSIIDILKEEDITLRYGLDIIETAGIIAWVIDLLNEGLLPQEYAEGLHISAHDRTAILEMVEKIATRQGLGDILAEGSTSTAETLGETAVTSLSSGSIEHDITPAAALDSVVAASEDTDSLDYFGLDLFNLSEMALIHVYSQGDSWEGPLNADETEYEGKARQVQWCQNARIAAESLGICQTRSVFMNVVYPDLGEWAKTLSLATGISIDPSGIWQAAERTAAVERLININQGFTSLHENIPDQFFGTEDDWVAPTGRLILDRDQFTELVNEYCKLRGWNKKGAPKEDKL